MDMDMNTDIDTDKKKKNTKIFTRMIESFSIVIVLALLLGVIGAVMINMVADKTGEIYNVHILGIEQLNMAQSSYNHMRLNINKSAIAALSGNAEEVHKREGYFLTGKNELDERLEEFEKNETNEDIKRKINDFRVVESAYLEKTDAFFSICFVASSGRDVETVNKAVEDLSEKAYIVEQTLSDIIAAESAEAAKAKSDTDAFNLLSKIVQIILLVAIIIFSACVAFVMSNRIEKNLKSIIDKMTVSTINISASAAQLNGASESLAAGSSKQAAAIEETSATMNETASMVAQNAENTRIASQIAASATEMAGKGMKEMTDMVKTMEQIKESSDKISKIVKTIDDIAFQTNLLSINAAVEAARAGGDAGRSFAVVAQEVRELAQMSANASAETAEIIRKNIILTNSGREASKWVSATLGEITGQTDQLNKLMSEINSASEEQASGINQVNMAVSQMEKITQDNAAVAEENAASSISMREEIKNLESAVYIAKELIRNRKNKSETETEYETKTDETAQISDTDMYLSDDTDNFDNSENTQLKSLNKISKTSLTSGTDKDDPEKIIPLDDKDDF